MRTRGILKEGLSLAGALLLAMRPVLAQQPASTPDASENPTANAIPASPLIPESPAAVSKPPRPAARPPAAQRAATPKISKTEANVEDMKIGIRMYEVKTMALRDPAIQEQISWAKAAKTDEGQRERLIKYYKMLFARIVKIDATLKPLAATLQKNAIARIEQKNIEKSILIEPE